MRFSVLRWHPRGDRLSLPNPNPLPEGEGIQSNPLLVERGFDKSPLLGERGFDKSPLLGERVRVRGGQNGYSVDSTDNWHFGWTCAVVVLIQQVHGETT